MSTKQNTPDTEKQRFRKPARVSPIRIVLIVIFGAMFLFSAYKLVTYYAERREADEFYGSLRSDFAPREDLFADITTATDPVSPDPNSPKTDPDGSTEEPKADTPPADVVYAENQSILELQGKYPNAVCWLTVPDTNINYPIMYSGDNAYYLRRNPDGKYLVSGTPFLEQTNASDFSDFKSVVYGHNMKNGTMFGDIDKFADREYLLAHTTAYLSFPAETRRYHIYAWLAVSSLDAEIYQNLDAGTQEERERFLSYVSEKATCINNSLTPSASDKFLILSTCNNANTAERHILVAFMSYGTN